ncbi:hypothetical protein COLO4_00261 [Corchorus olitorius]|uniref:Uncharacterized protein n=1 Tax=Corchorus olitorius TaxID=93759 RepID=A0A1R3L4A2_9ROSI|nr:hypothetical protein COLO4_00261 [Corchorus olitorius]
MSAEGKGFMDVARNPPWVLQCCLKTSYLSSSKTKICKICDTKLVGLASLVSLAKSLLVSTAPHSVKTRVVPFPSHPPALHLQRLMLHLHSRIATTVRPQFHQMIPLFNAHMPQSSNKAKEEIPTFEKVKQSLMVVARAQKQEPEDDFCTNYNCCGLLIFLIGGFIIGIAAPIRKILRLSRCLQFCRIDRRTDAAILFVLKMAVFAIHKYVNNHSIVNHSWQAVKQQRNNLKACREETRNFITWL